MKTNSMIKKALLAVGVLYLMHTPIIAEAQSGVAMAEIVVQSFGKDAVDVINKISIAINSQMVVIYNKIIGLTGDLIYQLDYALPKTIVQNTNLDKNKAAVNAGVAIDLENAIITAFADSDTKDNNTKKLIAQHASDDSDTTNNAILNADALFGPYSYNADDQKNARAFLENLLASAPEAKVIKISNNFTVPYGESQNGLEDPNATTSIALNPGNKNKNSTELNTYLLNNVPEYAKYKLAYRSMTAAKTLYAMNLYRIYQERIPRATTGTSMAQLRHNEAKKRLKPEYYKAMATASPAVVQQEILYLLAQLHNDLYEMHEDSERMIAMGALTGLQASAVSNVTLSMATKEIAKDIYCWFKEPTDEEKKNGAKERPKSCPAPGTTSAYGVTIPKPEIPSN